MRTETVYRSVVTPHNGSEVSRLSVAIHTFATRHISRGANLFWLASHMGHKGPELLFRHYGRYLKEYDNSTSNTSLKKNLI
ncbi:hypothetical protein BME65_11085 [Klebsiella pneumoniae]|nr:hypothetical protein BME65_11085 [Klebsiella pneumoniae]GKN50989.1 hypothetical protein NUBL17188_19390 [Klebsiella pneumoniae]